MELVQLDAVIRIGATMALLPLAWLLLSGARPVGLPAILFAPLAICLSAFVIGNTPASLLRPTGVAGAIAHLLSGYTVIFLWWFCLSCFDRQFRLRGGVLGVGLAWTVIAALDRGLLGATFAGKGLSGLLVALGFGIVAHLVWRLLAERAGDLIEQRHDARIMVAVLLGGMLFIDLAADAVFGLAWRPLPFALTQNLMIMVFGLWLAGRLLAVRHEILSWSVVAGEPMTAQLPSPGHGGEDELQRRLMLLMGTHRIFLDPELTFATFVARMGASERAVRRLVNHTLGYDHFRTFLNHYRVAEARRLLSDRHRGDDKLIAIALDCGFASIASFNRVFRAIEGCSPSAYRATAPRHGPDERHLADSSAAAGF